MTEANRVGRSGFFESRGEATNQWRWEVATQEIALTICLPPPN